MSIVRRPPLRALLMDLDDTICSQATFLDGAWSAVARRGGELGLAEAKLRAALVAIGGHGDDPVMVIAQAVLAIDAPETLVEPLAEAFVRYRPTVLEPHRGVANALDALAGRIRLGLITDGDPVQQRAKLAATGLGDVFDVVVCTDDVGRQFRKPHPLGFELALADLGASPEETVMVGDGPDDDMVGARRVGMETIRVRQGRQLARPDRSLHWADSTADALAMVAGRLLVGSLL